MTGYILCALPIVMLVVINMINPGYSNVLINTPVGKMLCYLGIFLLTAGASLSGRSSTESRYSTVPVVFYLVLGVIIFGVVTLLLTPNLFRPSPEAQRILDVVQSERVDQRHRRRTVSEQGPESGN